jgi:C1A family cysteine protease
MIAFASHAQTKGYVNPSAAYCEKMGYTYENRVDEKGNSFGVCILPNDSVVDAWDFFRGKVATEYSYCKKMGYTTEYVRTDSNGYISECAVCIEELKTGGENRIRMTDLMEQKGEPLINVAEKKSANIIIENAKPASNLKGTGTLPNAFDWRNYNGHSYIGGVRNQGICGSCYSFGANAAAEGTYNFANGLYDANCVDLSESFIAWCLGSISPYSSHFSGCEGADWDYQELQALCDSGVCFESSFPYVESSPGACTHWNDDRVKMNNWYRVDCSDTTAIKTAIMTYGVVDAAVNTINTFNNYTTGIYVDLQTECSGSPTCAYETTNHAIGLVGWGHDATYGLYWILRNSWGSNWGESGYMRIKWNAARVACEVCYVEYIVPDENDPTVFTPTSATTSQIDLSWNLNTNNDPVLLAWSSNETFGTPVNSAIYTPGNVIPGGGTVLYYGSTNIYSHTPLSPATTYHYKIWSDVSGTWSTGVETKATTDCKPVTSFPWNEGFENGGLIPGCWSEEQVDNSGVSWSFITGNGGSNPSAAHAGTYNACLKDESTDRNLTRLVSPALDFGQYSDATLTFWHTQAVWPSDQDSLTVYYRTTETGDWKQLATYNKSITAWDPDTINLPNLSSNYFICFEGNAKWGYGVCVDDVTITATPGVATNFNITNTSVLDGESTCYNATDTIIVAGGGTTVEFLNGSTVNLIAGKCISILPGFHAYEGNFTNAHITAEALFCDALPAGISVAQNNEKSKPTVEIPAINKKVEQLVKVYPNPNNGRFTLELTTFEGPSQITISNTLGSIVYQSAVKNTGITELELSNLRKGIYIVNVKNGNAIKTNKMIIQ